jgi:hypothetical protein
MIIVSFLRKAVTMTVRLFSQEKDKVTYTVPVEHTDTQRSIIAFRREPDSARKVNVAKDIIRLRDVICFSGTPLQRQGSINFNLSAKIPKGVSFADAEAAYDDLQGLLSRAETREFFLSNYLPN